MTKLLRLSEITDAVRYGVISIGNFDGVHRGHAVLIGAARRLADRLHGPVVAVAFDPHPAEILRPDRAPAQLTWLERRAELLGEQGADFLVIIPIGQAFLNLSATEFFVSLVRDQFASKGIVEGPNFFFGRSRQGNIETLRSLCEQHSIELSVAESSKDAESMISSTRVRDFIRSGDIDAANGLMGHPHRLRGTVGHGAGRGKSIGFPTANLTDIDVLVPGVGVYGGHAIVDGNRHTAAIHIGPNPTFDDSEKRKVEVHLLDYNGDLYQRPMMVDVDTRVRDIVRFDSPEKLVEQLNKDISSIRENQ
ncbi:Riboflavin kinase [Novipirellula aureliae]|uniref:Riboflavin biosynthesis protein n=1 Tax=Novipirellula aureliae TaxID=2527966 RepID=A0A5C6E4Q9_9BACT|nr:riboflavin biosynthesis protein RibF [Novipirellula aureliae]TWU43898.1 Riboflavin kinase [Novipirellula aureliae]